MIYFVQAGEAGPIKIGFVEADDLAVVERRVQLLQCGNAETLHLRATTLGGLDEEQRLHREFAYGHIRGEWFRADTDGLRNAIAHAKRQSTVTAWQVRDDGEQVCEWCRTRRVIPPRRSLCSRECAEAKRRADAKRRGGVVA